LTKQLGELIPGTNGSRTSDPRPLLLDALLVLGPHDCFKAYAREPQELTAFGQSATRCVVCGVGGARVVAFNDDSKGVRSSIAEIYVHTQLATRYNDFSTS
jgi:hypothetical protein